jgi:hypothetical protein
MYLWKRATPYVEKQFGSVEGLKTVGVSDSLLWERRELVYTLELMASDM